MTGLWEGKLNNMTVYIDFDDDTKHNRFWTIELDSVHQYYIDLITQTRAYNYYNLYIMQELMYYNEPINLSFLGNWSTEGHPHIIILPYLQLALKWDSKHHKWEYENYGWNSTSLDSSGSFGSLTSSDYSIPSLAEPIDEFELEDSHLG